MSKPEKIGETIRAEASRLRAESRRDAVSRDPTRDEKNLFVEVARAVCPGFIIPERNKHLLNDIVRWCLMLDGALDPDKGLWLYGDIGTGKTTMLEVIRDYCKIVRPAISYRDAHNPREMEKSKLAYGFRITNASMVAGIFAVDGYSGIEEFIINRRQAFDEVGRECIPTSHFGNMENVFAYIIQRRYDLRRGDFTHVTSNLESEQIRAVYGDFIYDRCIEMFNFVKMSGTSWR